MPNVITSDDPQISVAAGIIIGLLGSFVQSLGLTIQRKSHVLNEALPEAQRRVEHRRPLWLLGFAIFISSNILGSVFQIAALPVVILGPLGAVSLLWNAFFARFLLGDVFSPWMILGTLLIAGGAVLIAFFGIVREPAHSLDDLLRLLLRPAFIVYFSLLILVVIIALVITHFVELSMKKQAIVLPPSPTLEASPPLAPFNATNNHNALLSTSETTNATSLSAQVAERTPLLIRKPSGSDSSIDSELWTAPKPSRRALFVAVSFASFSGILSGMCLIFAKAGVELLLLTIGGKNQFWRWEAWVLLLGLVICALLQLWYLHKSLVLADPTLVCPLAFCFYNISSIFNGLVYFDQFGALSSRNLGLVILGIAILLGGVWVVSIPAGSEGGVNLGWHEGAEDVEEDEVEAGALERERVRQRHQSISMTPVATPPPTGRATSPEVIVDLSEPLDRAQPTIVSPTDAEEFPQHDRSGSTGSAGLVSPRASGIYGRRRRPTTMRHESHGSPTTSPLLSPTAGVPRLQLPGGGFSIGLSPISPGFALAPRGRDGRRISGANQGRISLGDVVAASMRRTVSEGDAARRGVLSDGDEEGAEGAGNESGGDVEVGRVSEPAQKPSARARWRRIRHALFHR